MVYLKGLKSYQPSKFKRVDFLPLYLVKRTFRLHFYWRLFSPLRYTKVIYLFGKPRSVVIMPEKLKGGVACLYCARPLSKWQFCFINRQRYHIHCLKLYITVNIKTCRVALLFNTLHVYLSYTCIKDARVSFFS